MNVNPAPGTLEDIISKEKIRGIVQKKKVSCSG